MFRKLLTGIVILVAVIGNVSQASALSLGSLINGQTHFYTVQFRSDSKAVVYAKLVFQNGSSSTDRDSFSFSLPDGVKVNNFSSQQILAKSSSPVPCLRYETLQEYQARTGTTTSLPIYDAKNSMQKLCLEKGQAEYDEGFDFASGTQDYAYSYYSPSYLYRDNYEYADIKPEVKDNTYTLKLAHAVKPHKQGAVLVSFTSDSYASSVLGYSKYSFRTLRVDEMVDSANVAIAFDQELYSRDVTQKRVSESSSSDKTSSTIGATANSYKSSSLDRLASSVGQGGVYTRTQTRMIPSDVMKVSGVYATNQILLFAKEILITLLVLAIFALILIRFIRYKRLHHKEVAAVDTKKDDTPIIEINSSSINYGKLAIVSAVSIGTTIIVGMLFGGLIAISNKSSYGTLSAASQTVSAIFAIVAFGSSIFVAPLIWVLRDGLRQVFAWLAIHVILVTILCFISVIILSLLQSGPIDGGPYPAMY